MRSRIGWTLLAAATLAGAIWAMAKRELPALSPLAFAELYATPLPKPEIPSRVYHLGHSLVGRDMPAMLSQLMGNSHASQLGWGASLKNHWQAKVPGFAEENAHPNHRPAKQALENPDLKNPDHDAVVLTEMVELRDAIRWHNSAEFLAKWVRLARNGNPNARVYLYETWHRLDDPQGWLERIDTDLANLWEGQLLRRAMAQPNIGTIYVIPGGQVMAAAVREIEAGRIPGLSNRNDLFAKSSDGGVDPIHLNDLGAYVIALAHYGVLTHRSPVGLPHQLTRADGSTATAFSADAARALQQLVWQVITRYPATGVAQER